MRLPTVFLMGFIGFVMLFAAALNRSPGPQSDEAALGFVMGRDFTALLSNPNVTLKIQRGNGTVTYVWTSENPARLSEIEGMGQHMIGARELLEMRQPVPQDDDMRTVSLF